EGGGGVTRRGGRLGGGGEKAGGGPGRPPAAGLDAAARRAAGLVVHAERGAPRQAGVVGAAVVVDLEVRAETGRPGVEIDEDGVPGRDRERVGGGAGQAAIAGGQGVTAGGVEDEVAERGDPV